MPPWTSASSLAEETRTYPASVLPQDSVENQDEFIWALAGSRKIRGDVIGRENDEWYILRTVCPEEDRPETAFATALFLLTDSHKYVRNAAPRSLP